MRATWLRNTLFASTLATVVGLFPAAQAQDRGTPFDSGTTLGELYRLLQQDYRTSPSLERFLLENAVEGLELNAAKGPVLAGMPLFNLAKRMKLSREILGKIDRKADARVIAAIVRSSRLGREVDRRRTRGREGVGTRGAEVLLLRLLPGAAPFGLRNAPLQAHCQCLEAINGRVQQAADAVGVVHLQAKGVRRAIVARGRVPGHQATLVAPEVVGPGRGAFHLGDVSLEQPRVTAGQGDDLALRHPAADVGVQLGAQRLRGAVPAEVKEAAGVDGGQLSHVAGRHQSPRRLAPAAGRCRWPGCPAASGRASA